jgi:phage shock protein PspC (stress-responsive transcriptional regulator)
MQDTIPVGSPAPSTAGDEPAAQAASQRVLRRSRDRMLGGVAGGLGDYFDIDPTLVRLGLVLATLMSGGIVLFGYLALWVIMPEASASALTPGHADSPALVTAPRSVSTREGNGAMLVGLVLVAVGGFLLLSQFPVFTMVGWGLQRFWWPSLLVLIGLVLILSRRPRD